MWDLRRNCYVGDVKNMALDDDTYFCIVGYLLEPRTVANWGKVKEEFEFLLLDILNG